MYKLLDTVRVQEMRNRGHTGGRKEEQNQCYNHISSEQKTKYSLNFILMPQQLF